MLRRVQFWAEERDAPLLRLNNCFLPCSNILNLIPDQLEENPITFDGQYERIIRLDAERTFLGVAQRTTLMNVLSILRKEFASYHQAMSYVAGFLLLTQSPSKVIDTMRGLYRTVLVDYWKEEPIGFATDAYVFDYLLAQYDPEVQQHLAKHYVFPETYTQKWFTTLCVGVLPFEALFLFFDTFLDESLRTSSNIFLFQFALSFIRHLRQEILGAQNVATLYAYLRFDVSLLLKNLKGNQMAMAIVKQAKDYDLTGYDLVVLRQKLFNEKLRARLEAARRAHQVDTKKLSTDVTSSSSSSSDEGDNDDDSSGENSVFTMNQLVSSMQQMHIE